MKKWNAMLPAEQEKLYRQRYLRTDNIQASIAMLILTIPLVAFVYNDYRFLGLGPAFYGIIGVRLVLLAATITAVIVLIRSRNFKAHDWIVTAWMIIGLVVITTINYSRPQNFVGHAVIDVVILLLVYLVIPVGLAIKYSLLIAFTVTETVFLLLDREAAGSVEIYTLMFAFLVANAAGMIGAWQLNLFRRREFQAELDEQKAREELKRLAEIDDLTGIYNSRIFNLMATAEIGRFRRYGRPFVFIMLDLDNFKLVNDQYGHLAGDKVLREVASAVSSKLRQIDVMGRLGGEEFGILLPETSLEKGKVVATRMQQALRRTKISIDAGKSLYVTASFGLTQPDKSDENMDSIVARADKALYQAKEEGRDRLVIAEV